jgi:ribosome-binding protein aMBF1 (putative translation factor)
MSIQSKVGERIKTYRERLEMSVEDLAAKSGVSVDVIKSIESSEVLPALGVLTKISRALGQRLGTFMDDQFKPDPIITRADDLEAAKVAGHGMNEFGYATH